MACDVPLDLPKHPEEDFHVARLQAMSSEEAPKITHYPLRMGAVQKSDTVQYLSHADV
jgi:hypothetical protein